MNKVYRVIWSHVTNTFIAVSELATSKGKVKSVSVIPSSQQSQVSASLPATFKVSALALASLMTFLPTQVMAQDVTADNLKVTGTSTFTGQATFNGAVVANSLTVNGKEVATQEQVNTAVAGKADQAALKTLENTVNTKANSTDLKALSDLVAQLGLVPGGEYTGIKYFKAKSTKTDASATGEDAIAIGPNAVSSKESAVAVGNAAIVNADKAIAMGHSSYAVKTADKGIAIGNDARVGSRQSGDVVYDGASSYVIGQGDGESSVAIGDTAISRGKASIALGKNALTSNKDAKTEISQNNIAIGTSAQTIASNNSIAFGKSARANNGANSSIALGDTAETFAEKAIAFGNMAIAKGESSLAFGTNSKAHTASTIAIGKDSEALSSQSIAIGETAQALPNKTISIGLNAGKGQESDKDGTKHSHINIGESAGAGVKGQYNIGIGTEAGMGVVGKANVALGIYAGTNLANSTETVGENVSIGNGANNYKTATPIQRATAVGSQSMTASDSSAFGYDTKATGEKAAAFGYASKAEGDLAVAIGANAIAGANNVALGANSLARTMPEATGYMTGQKSTLIVSVGSQEGNSTQHILRRLTNVADGSADQDAVTVAQLKRVSDDVTTKLQAQFNNLNHATTASEIKYATWTPDPDDDAKNKIVLKDNTRISNVAKAKVATDAVNLAQVQDLLSQDKIHYFSVNDKDLTEKPSNYDNDGAVGKLSMAIGQGVIAREERSVAIGNKASAHGVGSIAIGTFYEGSDALDDGKARSSATNATVANQPYKYGLAIGAGANTEGNNSLAIGSLASASNQDIQKGNVDRAIAIGYRATSSAQKANAIGDRAVANSLTGNAFGSEAFSDAAASNAIGTKAYAGGENSIAFGTNQNVKGKNSGSIGYAGAEADVHKTIVEGEGTYSVGNTNSTVTANESGIFGNSNAIKAKDNARVVGNKNLIGAIEEKAHVPGTPPASPANDLKDIYVTGYDNKISSDKKLAKDLSGLFVYGHNNKVAQLSNPDSTEEFILTNSSVIGANNTLNTAGSDFFVLGNNVNATLGNSVYLGKESAYTNGNSTIGMTAYSNMADNLNKSGYTFAGSQPVGVVTVGAEGKERRVQNVAAGLVTEHSTDAINGSQLFALTRPLRFAGDNSTLTNQDGKPATDVNVVSRSSNQAIDITGGETDTNKLTAKTDKNIGVIVTDDNSMEVRLAKNLTNLTEATFGADGDKTVINKDGMTITNGTSTVSLTETGLNNGNNKIINVAEGQADNDAVNVKQLNDLKAAGFGLEAESGENIKRPIGETIKVVGDKNVNTKILKDNADKADSLEISLANNITLGTEPKGTVAGEAGKLTLKDDKGTDRAVLDGAKGSLTLTSDKPDPTVPGAAPGADAVTAEIKVQRGKADVENEPAGNDLTKMKTRITYNTPGVASVEEVATLNDGLRFGANTGDTLKAKLNTQVDVKGAEANKTWDSFDAGHNIMTQINGSTITVALAKALSGLTSATFGDTAANPKDIAVIDKDGLTITEGDKTVKLTQAGLDNGGNQIKNVASGLTKDDGTATDLANAVGTNGVNVNDLRNIFKGNDDQGTPNTTGGFGLKDKAGNIFKQNLGETAQITGDANVNTKVVDGQNGAKALEVSLANQLTLGKAPEGAATAGEAGKVTLKDNKGVDRVVVDGGEGAISLTGEPAQAGTNAPTAKIKVAEGAAGLAETSDDPNTPNQNKKTRITYEITTPTGKVTEELATLNDGLKFGANDGEVHDAKLNTRVDVKGAATNVTWANFDMGQNIMTQINGNTITIALAKALAGLDSATFGNPAGDPKDGAVINKDGLTITQGDKTVKVTENGLDNGGNQIVNVDTGLKDNKGNTVKLKEADGDVLKNGVNVGDLKNAITDITSAANGGFGLKDKAGVELKQDLGTTAQITGDKNINTKVIDVTGGKALEVSLADEISLGKAGADGVDGKLGVAGKDGASVVLNGKDGSIGLTGPKGVDGKSVSTDISVKDGKAGVDGTNGADGTTKTRIVYTLKDKEGNPIKDKDGKPIEEEVATLNDGMKFVGNDGKEVIRKLNETLDIKGGLDATTVADNTKVSSGNVGVKSNAAGTGLEIVMKERPTFSGLVLNGKDDQDVAIKFEKDGKDGMSLAAVTDKDGNTTGLTIKNKEGNPGVTFNQDGRITNVKDGTDASDAVNVSQLEKGIAKATTKVAQGKNITVTPTTNADGSTTYTVATENDVDFNSVKVGDINITAEGINAGGKKVTNVADGDISPSSKDAVNGGQLHVVKEIAEAGWHLTANGEDSSNVKPKHIVDLNNTDGNIVLTKTAKDDKHNVTFGLSDNINVKEAVVVGEKGKDGVPAEGAVVISAKDGADGKDGISIVGKDGKDAVAISGKDGIGTIGLTGPAGADGKNANATISVKDGEKGLFENDGKDGNSKTRIVYKKPDGKEEQLATMNDGLVFGADSGTDHNAKLGSKVEIKGDDNITTAVAGSTIRVKLNDNINVKGVTVKEKFLVEKGATINMGNNVVDGVADGQVSATSKQAVNGSQLYRVQQQVNNNTMAINKLGNQLNKVDKDLRAGVAGATAVAFLQRPNEAGKSIVSLGVGHYKSESAVAVGYARNSDNNKISIKLGGGVNTRGDVNLGGSIGYQW
ncbi:YadA-like family protein [Pasteurella sp. P03HT]